MLIVPLAVAFAVTLATGQQLTYLLDEIEISTDVARLERLAADVEFSDREYETRQDPYGGPKIARSAAYVRLGRLGTAESLAAIRRIESRLRNRSTLPPVVSHGGWVPYPASHVGDSHWSWIAQTSASDGYDYILMSEGFYGDWSLFVCRYERKTERWSRPWLVPLNVDPWTRVSVRQVGQGRLHLGFTRTSDRQVPPPVSQTIDVAELTVDTDGDGWTDIEEKRLGLNPRSRDTDGDGIPDDRDSMPLFAMPTAPPSEDHQIVRRAILATFGLTGSSYALFVAPDSTAVHFDSNAGPMLYGERPKLSRGIRVGWRLVEKEGDRAIVEIGDYIGPLAASIHYVVLERKGAEWFVIGVALGMIS